MNILITGGAGFIGSRTVRFALNEGHNVIVIDDLSNSSVNSIDERADFVEGNILDKSILRKIFDENDIEVVIHFAAKINVEESIKCPDKYFLNNTIGTYTLLDVMKKYNTKKIVFSSTAAVYDELSIDVDSIDENYSINPKSPYGLSKKMAEDLIKYSSIYDLDFIVFRYFNVAGGVKKDYPYDKYTALVQRNCFIEKFTDCDFEIFGDKYNTPDGTCIRDFIHVNDIANAHIIAAEKILKSSEPSGIYNLGSGDGFSVMQVVEKIKEVSYSDKSIVVLPSRSGDIIRSVADIRKSEKIGFLNKANMATLDEIITDTLGEMK